MIRGVVFDMDGVLIDARLWHYEALNEALQIFGIRISDQEHELKFDGLPTKRKLSILVSEGILPEPLTSAVESIKQERTMRAAARLCFPRIENLLMLAALKQQGFKLAVATNSIRKTAEGFLGYAGILSFFDAVVSNEDVEMPKPAPDVYLAASAGLGLSPEECLAIEDNQYGIAAAKSAGCKVAILGDPGDLNFEFVQSYLGGNK